MNRKAWAAALAVAAACALLLLGPAIVGDETVFAGDIEVFEASRDRLVAEAWREGEGIPRWVPGILGGAPALPSQELGLLYPPNLVLAVLATDRAEAIGLALHLVLAAFGARALARALGAERAPALLSGLAFAFSGTFVSTHLTPVYVRSGAWLPWAIAGLLRAGSGERRGLLVATLALSGSYLAGDPQGCVVAAIGAAAIAVARSGPRGAGRVGLATAIAGALAALVCAAQLVPALAAFGDTQRQAGLTFQEATRWSLWPPELAGFFVPLAFGTEAVPGSRWFAAISPSHERAWGESHYLGPIVLSLIGASLSRAKEPAVRAGLALLVVFLPLALGEHAPFYALAHALPGGSLFRYPAKLLVPAVLGLSLMAGAGAGQLLAPETAPRARRAALAVLGWVAAIGLVGTGVAVLGPESLAARIEELASTPLDGARVAAFLAPRFAHVVLLSLGTLAVIRRVRSPRRLGAALVVLAALDLALAARAGIALAPREPFTRPPRVAAVLAEIEAAEKEPARIVPTESAQRPTDDEASVPLAARVYVAEREGLEPNTNLGYGVLSQGGFLSNAPARVARLFDREGLTPLRLAILQGGRFVLAADREVAAYAEGVAEIPRGRVLVKLRMAPRWAMLHEHARFVAGPGSALAAVADAGFDPRRECVLETVATPLEAGASAGRASLEGRLGIHGFAVSLEAPRAGWLVVREGYARGWVAEVDGGPAVPVVPADFLFRAVHIEKGAKRVVFRYEPPGLQAGVLLSAATLLALAGALGLALARSGRLGGDLEAGSMRR
ncbi:hypothetical protein HY251_06345 [bacterium]|nr:hypothetical protein [bacterium]